MVFVFRIAFITFSGVMGREVTFTLNGVRASSTAFATAAAAPAAARG